jgi:ribosome-binding protein aMBF1 (putative translation factor)
MSAHEENKHVSDYQNWEPSVMRRTRTFDEKKKAGEVITIVKQPVGNKQGANIVQKKLATDFDPENIKKVPTAGQDLATAIQKARIEKSWSQVELNQKCNFPANTVRDYENRLAVLNTQQLNTMNRILGVKLPRPSKD